MKKQFYTFPIKLDIIKTKCMKKENLFVISCIRSLYKHFWQNDSACDRDISFVAWRKKRGMCMSELLYMQVSDSLIKKIQEGILQENMKLSERKLAVEYQVSRTVIREAIKLLNEKGLVRTEYGKGTFVNQMNDRLSIDKIQDTLDSSRVTQVDVLEARELMETAMTQKDIAVLEELYERLKEYIEEPDEFILYDAKFHLALSICTHNRVLSIMTGTLNKMANREQFLSEGREHRERANQEHLNIIQALKNKNEKQLLEAMQLHISCIRSHVGGE